MGMFINPVFRYRCSVAGGIVGAYGLQIVLYLMGFRSHGTAAYSLGSYVQSKLVDVSVGSIFGYLQRWGVLGVKFTLKCTLGMIGLFIGYCVGEFLSES